MESSEQGQLSEPNPTIGFLAKAAIAFAALLWCLSIVLPVWETRMNESGQWDIVHGYFPALLGWLGLLAKCPAWVANLLLVPLLVTLRKPRNAGFWFSLVALAIAASAYVLPTLYGDNDEAVIVRRLIGYYFWLGSFIIIALAFAILAGATRRSWIVVRTLIVLLMILGLFGLEHWYPVGVSPLERTLKSPSDLTAFTTALARNPSQQEKDAALWWSIRGDLWMAQRTPSKQIGMLIAAGANPNQADRSRSSLLMQALSPRGSGGLVELLVRAGADVNARDYRGKTVLDIAVENGASPQCQQLLKSAGALSSGKPNP